MSETIEQKCIAKGVKLTDQRRIIAKVMSEAQDHPDVNELYIRVSQLDSKISIATVYRTVKLFEEAGIITKHDFKGGKARYEEVNEGHNWIRRWWNRKVTKKSCWKIWLWFSWS